VRLADCYTGWVQRDRVHLPAPGEKPYASAGKVAEVASLYALLYREMDITKHPPIMTAPFEAKLEVVAEPPDEDNRWVQVRLPGRRRAWIQRGDLAFGTATLSADQTAAFARRFVGLPYVWGGTTAFGYDCSGLTQMLCRRRGLNIPRDSADQARWEGFRPVARDQLQVGDLLYFGPAPDRVVHTGMYLGDGQFIHATTHIRPVIQVTALADKHWTALLQHCRRPK
jgi:hypothetical protein